MSTTEQILGTGLGVNWMPAPAHPDEDARMMELRYLDLVHTSDASLEGLTRLAARVFNVSVAHIGLPSADRNWVKAGIGIDIQSCDRAVSFCGHAIHETNILVVSDTWRDPRFANHPMTIGLPNIRFYAGAVIKGRDQVPLGTLCIVDDEPREFNEADRITLCHFRDIVQERILEFGENRLRLKETVQELRRDRVTGLLNEVGLRERLNNAIHWAGNDQASGFGVLVIELVKYSEIKRGHGQQVAKDALNSAGARLSKTLCDSCIHGRWRENAFMAIVPHGTSAESLTELACSVVAAFKRPLAVATGEMTVRVHVGISRFPNDGSDAMSLADAATHALEGLPSTHHTCFALADRDLNATILERLDLEERLRLALDQGDLSVLYQPKISVRRDRMDAAEALVRWDEPELGRIPPGRFIPIAEAAGLIGILGNYVLEQACHDAASWNKDKKERTTVAVNISTIQLHDDTFSATMSRALERTGLDGDLLILEITESALMESPEAVMRNMREIADLGVRFAIDDFGTGYANFNYLSELPIHSLKIDRSFINQIDKSESKARICQAMIALGRALDLVVVAEGVETHEQVLYLKAYGCDQLQGFFFSKAINSLDFQDFIRRQSGTNDG